jgi:hypothetical protein
MFISIPPNAILARYALQSSGAYAVETVTHKVLAASFYDLRHQYTATSTINGSGCWVVLIPIPQPTQTTLF